MFITLAAGARSNELKARVQRARVRTSCHALRYDFRTLSSYMNIYIILNSYTHASTQACPRTRRQRVLLLLLVVLLLLLLMPMPMPMLHVWLCSLRRLAGAFSAAIETQQYVCIYINISIYT